ncbi:hypothetical protein AOT83_06040 [Mycobacteroides sp. H001]|uniref:hypothetical protein n=1 Tax=Mycobacteroides TaxID=670516 RepID=UPI0007159368|nr:MULTISPECIES: hypothetical protein [Mycobacteroides]KRQ27789.1 hypothetical protein AOT86_10835 [Mycobacteroides sp. H072]KRQ41744.1 hypothetical protein AOT84_00950 [Mycobacteroides sp. H002]KRQ53936.1 hypothetical protein AOT85_06200 [Mycobacteroides sp. H054]KRQ71810.1 hypothetical protein AOT83_06040 [Mycobacteroides sp. H001]OHU37046.1 hypothetical protein BKG79_15615 [Mycobacteroides chelonae]
MGAAPAAGGVGGVVFDPTPHLNALEHGLKDWLNKPTRNILDELNLNPSDRNAQDRNAQDQAAADAGAAGGGDMVAGLMSPMLQMLGTLGTGIFQGLNPQQMFQPMTQAFQQGAQSLQGLMGQMGQGGSGWAGAGAAGTAAKTAETLGNGAAVSAQGAALGGQGMTAGADTSQGYTRLLELIQETQHRLEALSGGIPFTAPEMGETAGSATARAVEIVTELETALTGQAANMTATGAPVALAQGPTSMMSMMGPMMQIAMSMMSPAMQMATMPLTMGSQMLTQGMQAGVQAATSMAQAAGKGGAGAGSGLGAAAKGLSSAGLGSAAAAPKIGGGGAGIGSGGGGGTIAARALPSAVPANMASVSESGSATQAAAVRGAGVVAAGSSGAGMMGGAPMGGAGARGAGAGGGSGDHSAANFLHTSDQGGEIIGDLGTVTPAVIGENDPNADVDVELRIT